MPFIASRKKTRRIKVGNVPVGGMAPISVQSMTNTATPNIAATVSQIERLQNEPSAEVKKSQLSLLDSLTKKNEKK